MIAGTKQDRALYEDVNSQGTAADDDDVPQGVEERASLTFSVFNTRVNEEESMTRAGTKDCASSSGCNKDKEVQYKNNNTWNSLEMDAMDDAKHVEVCDSAHESRDQRTGWGTPNWGKE